MGKATELYAFHELAGKLFGLLNTNSSGQAQRPRIRLFGKNDVMFIGYFPPLKEILADAI